jgi:hypothetical protein
VRTLGLGRFSLAHGIGDTDTFYTAMDPTQTLAAFDRFLASNELHFEATVIGGAALALLGITTRQTRDCDVLDPVLPEDIARAARDFASRQRAAGNDLMDDWLNNGPRDLINVLPSGWSERLVDLLVGDGLVLRTLGREDLLRTKLFALCDRALDLADCLALEPTSGELNDLLPWVERQDANPDWPSHVRETLADLGRRLGHGL